MRIGLALSCVLTAGCGFSSPKVTEDLPDADPLPDGACMSFAEQLDTCLLPNENALAFMLDGDYTLDTDTGILKNSMGIETPIVSTLAMTPGGEVRVLVATTVTLAPNTKLRAVGVRGLAIVARGAILLQANAMIDVSKGGAGYRGSCGTEAAADGMPDMAGAGAGGGGGFGSTGGAGGNGNSETPETPGGAGGKVAPVAPAGPLGGCSGAKGGKGDAPTNDGGAGGKSGGAVYVMSRMSIGIASGAGIDAGGEGGAGGKFDAGATGTLGNAGGGGGGSGGSIFLESPVIRSQGVLAANGGGGGEGSGGGNAGTPGTPGDFGTARADGGRGGANDGADGGDGGFVTTPAGQKTTQVKQGGGGGGGGSVGFIRIRSADAMLGTLVSPTTM